jgi:hypothetical protein
MRKLYYRIVIIGSIIAISALVGIGPASAHWW